MSCNWDVHCLDCHVDSGLPINSEFQGIEIIRLLIRHRKKLEPLERLLDADGVWTMGFSLNGEAVVASFFGEHRGHRLVPINGRGELDSMNGKEVAPCTAG